jgi:hypothetical protein
MSTVFIWWGIAALVLLVAAGWIGTIPDRTKGNLLGILVDGRGRMSLSQFQLVLWTIVVLSLLMGVFFARLFGGVSQPQNFTIPNELLIVMGISVGSTASAAAVKAGKDFRASASAGTGTGVKLIVARNASGAPTPKFSQLFLTEEGSVEYVDITRFQNFWLTLILIVAYVAWAVAYLATKTPAKLTALPGFDSSMVTLLGISHAGYLAGKLPDKP